jgi:flagellar biosynthesis chaperone FliJ
MSRTAALVERRRDAQEALARALGTRRDLRVIERLRDRRKSAFNLESDRLEQRQIDALAVQRYGASPHAGTSPHAGAMRTLRGDHRPD